MTLPFEPEPIEKLGLRLKAALGRVWDGPAIAAELAGGGDPDRPGRHRAHVFDFQEEEHCVRLVVSVDDCGPLTGLRLHVSASTPNGIPVEPRVRELMAQIGLVGLRPDCRRVGPGGVLHLYYPWAGGDAFAGEEMVCVICGTRRKSDAGTQSGWGVFMTAQGRFYACAAEIPKPGAPAGAVDRFWARLDHAIRTRHGGACAMPAVAMPQSAARKVVGN